MNWEKIKDKCGFGFILTVEESSVCKIIGNLAVRALTCVLTRMPPPPPSHGWVPSKTHPLMQWNC